MKTAPSEIQIDNMIKSLYELFAESLGVKIEIIKKEETNEKKTK